MVLTTARSTGEFAIAPARLRELVEKKLPSLAAAVGTEAACMAQLRCVSGVRWSLAHNGMDNLVSLAE
jgi:hypothetical protein